MPNATNSCDRSGKKHHI